MIPAVLNAADPVTKVFRVRYSDAGEAAEIIPLMIPSSDGLTIRRSGDQLIAQGSAVQIAEVETMLRELDRPPRNVQVNVQFSRSGSASSYEAGVRQRGPVIIHDGEVRGNFSGRVRNQRTTSQENTMQMLVAASGRRAMLRVGETVPHVKWLTEYGHRHGYIREHEIEWRDVGAFLAVEPEIIDGDLIKVRVTPVLSGKRNNGGEEVIEFVEVATEVIARSGQTVTIGSFSKDKEFSDRFLVGRSGGGESAVTGITLTPKILQ